MEILHIDVAVRCRLPLTPQEQAFLGRGFWAGMGVRCWLGRGRGQPTSLPTSPLHSPSTEMSWMAKRMMVQIMPRSSSGSIRQSLPRVGGGGDMFH